VTVQNEVWLTTLAGMGLVALAFIYVIAKSGKPADARQVRLPRFTAGSGRRHRARR
jgi:hypothetical protein